MCVSAHTSTDDPGCIHSVSKAERTKLLFKRALLHFRVLYLWPDGSSVECRFRG